MLKEKIFYKDDLPINVITAHIDEYPIHFHDDIEVAFVLEGTVHLKNGYYNYTLREGDVFILNDREIHSFMKTDTDNVVMMLQMDIMYFSKYYTNFKNCFFVTDMEDEDESMEVLRGILSRIMMQTIEKGPDYEQSIIESAHNLIGVLLADFQYFAMEDGKFINEAKNKGNKILAGRMNRITDYMYENYTRRLTLNEVAEKEHLSIYYLSHVIKTASGLSFQELLSFIRVEESEKLVLGTNKKIGTIAEESGFSAVRYYIKYFTKWFGMHPSEYRKLFTGKVSSREILAKYQLATPEHIKELIRKDQSHIYNDFESDGVINSQVINLELSEIDEMDCTLECRIKTLLKTENMRPAANLLKVFNDLREEQILSGDMFTISKKVLKNSKKVESLSILTYNINVEIAKISQDKLLTSEVLDRIKAINNKTEILYRISGLSGTYKVSRVKLFKENIISAYDVKVFEYEREDLRKITLSKLGANPSVSSMEITVTDTLAIQTNLEGLSAELVMIDRADPI